MALGAPTCFLDPADLELVSSQYINDETSITIANEIDVLKFLINNKHPNIIEPIEILEDSSKIYIVTELLESKYNLKSYINFIKSEICALYHTLGRVTCEK